MLWLQAQEVHKSQVANAQDDVASKSAARGRELCKPHKERHYTHVLPSQRTLQLYKKLQSNSNRENGSLQVQQLR